ncbi:MAG: hypothetical protein ACPGWR_07085 [Ardenticatenaceae bacterium]
MGRRENQYRYQLLQQYLQEGWVVDPPVFVRSEWAIQQKDRHTYHFILKRAKRLDLLAIPRSEELETFVREQELRLSYL